MHQTFRKGRYRQIANAPNQVNNVSFLLNIQRVFGKFLPLSDISVRFSLFSILESSMKVWLISSLHHLFESKILRNISGRQSTQNNANNYSILLAAVVGAITCIGLW